MKNFDFFQKSFMVSLLMFLLLFIGSFFTDKTSDANQIFNAVYATGFCIMLFVSLGNWLIVKNNQDPAVIEFEKNRIKNLEAEML